MSTTDHGAAFEAYATSTAFRVSLTKPMAMALWTINEVQAGRQRAYDIPGVGHGTGVADHFIRSLHCLRERGLVLWEDPSAMRPKGCRPAHRLTEAGKHVLALCAIARLVPDARPANDFVVPKRKSA